MSHGDVLHRRYNFASNEARNVGSTVAGSRSYRELHRTRRSTPSRERGLPRDQGLRCVFRGVSRLFQDSADRGAVHAFSHAGRVRPPTGPSDGKARRFLHIVCGNGEEISKVLNCLLTGWSRSPRRLFTGTSQSFTHAFFHRQTVLKGVEARQDLFNCELVPSRNREPHAPAHSRFTQS